MTAIDTRAFLADLYELRESGRFRTGVARQGAGCGKSGQSRLGHCGRVLLTENNTATTPPHKPNPSPPRT
ncbi:hypothetical protein, partial [Methylobacterium radiotolerans]|uniref:hypothetical protein n=1 Tax=Methylobacterium radiotolerans TaxID=31998 RepID=UPI003F67DBAA